MANMPITKYNPFREVEKIFEDDDLFGFFPAVKRSFGPAMDIYETEKEVVVEMQMPKVDPAKLNISVENGVLRVEGGEEEEKEEKDKNYYRKEIRRGHFVRHATLPVPVKEDGADASYENGMLKITIPKAEVKKGKRIEVKIR